MKFFQRRAAFAFQILLIAFCIAAHSPLHAQTPGRLSWEPLPAIPNSLGVAGPFVGVHHHTLMVAGGANFPVPVWDSDKQWVDDIFGLQAVEPDSSNAQYRWVSLGKLDKAVAYGANVSTPDGIICIGGNDSNAIFNDCFSLSWDMQQKQLNRRPLPDLPMPLAYGQACRVGNRVYVAGGQSGFSLDTAVNTMWSLDLNHLQDGWFKHPAWPGPPRAFNITVAQNNGFEDCIYLIGGRYQDGEDVRFLSDCWEFNPKSGSWRERAAMPFPVAAGTAVAFGQSHILVLSGDDGNLFHQTDELRDQHPGFPKRTIAYHSITNTWTSMGESPANQVTTTAVEWNGMLVLPSGEIRPRVRSPEVWKITLPASKGFFGTWDYLVLVCYLASLIMIGVYFSRRTRNTNDYFRAAGKIPWWAAGCSIFATMLSSLTFTGVPSKAFAQDWVYAVGNFMIPVVAVLAVYIALPFYRRIDATSAYEYLEKRFHWTVRIFGSLSFSVFHLFRMAIVMSLTGLALAVATPLTPIQSVWIMGLLSVMYCTLGGISAVIWTDTLQTFVLLGGALIAITWMLIGTGENPADLWEIAQKNAKFEIANWHLNPLSTQIALWVIVLGAIGQNTASYTADQAVVQRYMTTESEALAARAIWTNAVLTIPATILFFGIGTSLYLYYHLHPERLDPAITTDQIFPYFISRELPIGLSGLIVAAIFAAAQSTVSTSMNSVATTVVTDCIRPLQFKLSEPALLRLAQTFTVFFGLAGTLIAISFVSPSIRSLFDQFMKVIGLFMGVLGGLFILGALVPRANTLGAWVGAITGSLTMFVTWQFTEVNGYLYTAIGITTCVASGFVGSLLASPPTSVEYLTIRSLKDSS